MADTDTMGKGPTQLAELISVSAKAFPTSGLHFAIRQTNELRQRHRAVILTKVGMAVLVKLGHF